MIKKFLIFLLITLILTFSVYFLWQKFITKKNNQINLNNFSNQENDQNYKIKIQNELKDNLENQEKDIIKDIIRKINSNSKVVNYWFYQNDIFYLNQDSEVYKIEKNNQDKKISNFYEPMSFIKSYQSPNNEKILMAFNDPYSPQWLIFDNLDLTWRPLPENIIEANWLNPNEIIAILRENNNYKLIKLDKNFNSQTLINNFNFFDFYLYPLNEKNIIIQEKPSDNRPETKIFNLNLDNKEIKNIKINNNEILIKPIDQNLLLRYDSSNNLIIDYLKNFEKINLKTLIDKCSFQINNNGYIFYCFIPANKFNFDQYYQKEIKTLDNKLIKIEIIKNNDKIEINNLKIDLTAITNKIKIDAFKIFSLNENIYFINNYDNNLYEISLTNLKEKLTENNLTNEELEFSESEEEN